VLRVAEAGDRLGGLAQALDVAHGDGSQSSPVARWSATHSA
jgi:hypothetical protein